MSKPANGRGRDSKKHRLIPLPKNGTKSDERFQKMHRTEWCAEANKLVQGRGSKYMKKGNVQDQNSKSKNLKEGVEVAGKRYCYASSQWKPQLEQGSFQHEKMGILEKHKSWCACQQKASRATLPRTAPCWRTLASGKSMWLGSSTVGL